MTAPSDTGGMYERTSFIHPRIAGSTDTSSVRITTCPGPGSGTGDVTSRKSVAAGSPTGRAARRI